MVRNLIQDIVPKRSIRNVSIPEARVKTSSRPIPVVEEKPRQPVYQPPEVIEEEEPMIPELHKEIEIEEGKEPPTKRPISKKSLFIGGGVFFVLIGLFSILNFFHSVTVTVTQKSFNASIAGEIQAGRSANSDQAPFESLMLKKEGSIVVRSTGEQEVQKKASGTIIVFNNHSSAPQRLIKNTRFESPEGLIFRIDSSVTVPGKKGTIPGSIEVNVSADEAGEKYNTGLTDFNIPGFKGDPRFTTFYGRSKTVMSGGFSGVMKVVSDSDRKNAEDEIKSKLSADILKEAESKVPEGFVLYPKAYRIDWNIFPQENLEADQVRLKIEGVLTAVVFTKKDFSTFLAERFLKDYEGESIEVKNINELNVVPSNSDFKPATDSVIDFSVTGVAQFVWAVDEAKLKQALLGKDKDAFTQILKDFITIDKADAKTTPFWKSTFPKKLESITIKTIF